MDKQDQRFVVSELQWDIDEWEWNAELTTDKIISLAKHLVERDWRKQNVERTLAGSDNLPDEWKEPVAKAIAEIQEKYPRRRLVYRPELDKEAND